MSRWLHAIKGYQSSVPEVIRPTSHIIAICRGSYVFLYGVFNDIVCSSDYRYVPQNDVSVNDGEHIRRWSHKVIIL